MQSVTVTLCDETLDSLDALARREHDGDRDAAAQALLAEWIKRR